MAISDELSRLITAKAGIKSALEEKGLTIGDSSTLDEYPALIQEMQTGGGGYDTSTIIDLIEGDITSFEIPEGTTKIRPHFFYGFNFGERSLYIPESIFEIGDNAFQGSTVRSIFIGNNIIHIYGNQTFDNDSRISSYKIKEVVFLLDEEKRSLVTGTVYRPFNPSTYIYFNSSVYDFYKQQSPFNAQMYLNNTLPLAAIDYDASTYTVTASGRDNVELYIDASLCDSSVYTFVPDTIDVSHNITVKSVDPSLGILDEVTQEVLVEGETQELKNYMALTAVQNSSVIFLNSDNNVDLKYSSDGVNWSNMTFGSAGKLNLPAGETLYFKGNNPNPVTGLGAFNLTGKVDASGNVMSLIYDENFENQSTVPDYAFQSLFMNCSSLRSVENLLLPATTLGTNCYKSMFMSCSNITKAPELPALTLVSGCYDDIFSSCSKLNYIKAMFTTEPSDTYLRSWASGVAMEGTLVLNAAAEWDPKDYDMELGDIVLDWTIEKVNA